MHFVMRMFFRGIYFPQRNARVWTKLVAQNRRPLLQLIKGGLRQIQGRPPADADGRRSESGQLNLRARFRLINKRHGRLRLALL